MTNLTIHQLIAALESADVWDERDIEGRAVPETIATLREYAYALACERGERETGFSSSDSPSRPPRA